MRLIDECARRGLPWADGQPVDVAVLGATGLVGTRIVERVCRHPWFRLREVSASPAAAGARLMDRTELSPDAREAVGDLRLCAPGSPLQSPLVLSSLPKSAAAEWEPHYADAGHLICSNASAHRLDADAALIVPEVNGDTLAAALGERRARGRGFIVTNPNCMISGLALALAPLHRAFGVEALTLVTLQAISGAGRRGLDALSIQGNVIPHIAGETDKFAPELARLLDAEIGVSATVHRVPVNIGHLASVFVTLREPHRDAGHLESCFDDFRAPEAILALPSAPRRTLLRWTSADRPQPRLDIDHGDGMTVSVGAVVRDAQHDARFEVLVNNLERGAAGACVLNAELATTVAVAASNLVSPSGV